MTLQEGKKTEQRVIKFRVVCNGEITGYERLVEGGWEWMCPELNPDTGERWTKGIMHDYSYPEIKYERNQFTGLYSVDRIEAYEWDVIEFSNTEGKIFKHKLWYDMSGCCLMVGSLPYLRLHESGFIQPSKLQFNIIGNIYQK